MSEAIIEHIEFLFYRFGAEPLHSEPVTLLEHALQCAHLAEHAGADDALVTAALLHDLGHLLAHDERHAIAPADRHASSGLGLLRGAFDEAVIEPIVLHVDAKRYLGAVDEGYLARLAPASRARLERQGGPFDADQCRAFAVLPGASTALLLRRWDDASRRPGVATPALEHFLERARRCLRTDRIPSLPEGVAVAALLRPGLTPAA